MYIVLVTYTNIKYTKVPGQTILLFIMANACNIFTTCKTTRRLITAGGILGPFGQQYTDFGLI